MNISVPDVRCNTQSTVLRALLLASAVAFVAPAAQARRAVATPWADLFDEGRPLRRPARSAAAPAALISVPLPRPRPAEAPAAEQAKPAAPPVPEQEKAAIEKPARPAPPSQCRQALTDTIAIAPSIPDITGPGSCGGSDLVRLDAVVLPGGGRVPLKPAATLRCEMASAIAHWVRDDIAPMAQASGTPLGELDNFDSFDCRGRNRVAGAKLSEHGRANALDIRGFRFGSGPMVSMTEQATARELREKVLASVCARFTTVLGPGSDGYHEDHIHLDIAERRSGYRICQWAIYDPMPDVAPMMPAERPAEAPPRKIANSDDEAVPTSAGGDARANAASASQQPTDRKRLLRRRR